GKKGANNQVNNPPDSPYLFLYEAPWRDAAVRRLPEEVAAALDLTRRDAGRVAKYTRILVDLLRKNGLLVEEFTNEEGVEMRVSDSNPLWDIQSGTGEKAVVLRGILVLRADELWQKVNYRLGIKSPFPVKILAPNADAQGKVNKAPEADKTSAPVPDTTDGLKVDLEDTKLQSELGLDSSPSDAPGATDAGPRRKKSPRAR